MVQNGQKWTLSRPPGGIDFTSLMVKMDPLETPRGYRFQSYDGKNRPPWGVDDPGWGHFGVTFWDQKMTPFLAKLWFYDY